jgi:hypothetical protein
LQSLKNPLQYSSELPIPLKHWLAALVQQTLHWRSALPFPERSQRWRQAISALGTRKPQVFAAGQVGFAAAAYDAHSSTATDVNFVLYTRVDLILAK